MNFLDNAFFTDFSAIATRNGTSTVTGVFDQPYGEAFGLIAGNDPVFRCLSSIGMALNDTLAIAGVSYKVTHIEPDGTGIDLCRLGAV